MTVLKIHLINQELF